MTTKPTYNGKNVCFTSVLGAAILIPGMASAQTTDAPAIEEVITTGSRIVRDGFDQPTPVSVMNEDEIHANAPGSISEFVMELPSVSGSTATTNSGSLSNGAAGISSLDSRGMGSGRTLVLFDGQRSVVSSTSGAVDTNTFPQPLISRV
ncbi:MAG: TonB-dependent receptor plug domain-containing protein, partial [Pseudohongiella sp.]